MLRSERYERIGGCGCDSREKKENEIDVESWRTVYKGRRINISA